MEKAIALVAQAVNSGQIPGAALGLVTRSGGWQTAYFGVQHRQDPQPITSQTYFDLASLTKVIFTVTEILRLVEEGLADLDDPLGRFMPEMAWMQGSDLPQRSLRQLITHTAGLPDWAPIYTWNTDPNLLRHQVLQHRWEVSAAGTTLYSDIGYILLGLVLERVRGQAIHTLGVRPGFSWRPQASSCAATEHCPWRQRVLQGEIHDENAFGLQGAGHAGLFGQLDGVLGFARDWLEGELLSQAALAELARPQTGQRALGWILRGESFSGGSLCSPHTLGHTGYTGTGVWVDLERGLAWALLTNRVHPSRHLPTGILELRKAVGNAIAAAYKESV